MQVSRANLRCARSRRRRRLLFRYLGLVECNSPPKDEFERRLVEGDVLESIGRLTLIVVEPRIDETRSNCAPVEIPED